MQKGHACRQAGFTPIFILIGLLIVVLAGGGGFWAYQNNFQNIRQINSFDSCSKIYSILESYPAQCNTPDGQHFVQSLSDKEKKKLVPPVSQNTNNVFKTREACEAQTGNKCHLEMCQGSMDSSPNLDCKPGWYQDKNISNETADWKTYERQENGYYFSIKYPPNMTVSKTSINETIFTFSNSKPKYVEDYGTIIIGSKLLQNKDGLMDAIRKGYYGDSNTKLGFDKLTIDGANALGIIDPASKNFYIVRLTHNNNFMYIELNSNEGEISTSNTLKHILDSMLGTFKFLK